MENYCTLLINTDKGTAPPQQSEIMADLENPDCKVKIRALKTTIGLLLSGEPLPMVLMAVIRFCITQEDHQLKKLLMLYWEVVPKYGPDKRLLPEMILVCNALRNDLNHPNEYIRGCMLRFLCKLKEPELLEPLIASIKTNLTHRHSFVRRNAAMTVFRVYQNCPDLLPDAGELLETFIQQETDPTARRNAFLMLFNSDSQNAAMEYLLNNIDQVSKFGDGFSLVALELIRKVCLANPAQKSRFVRVLFALLNAASPAVSYEAAWTLSTLSSAPTAVRAVASTYAGLLNRQSDNNVKLIVLERLGSLKTHHTKVLQELLLDIMRALNSTNNDICKKTLDIAMDLVSPSNIEEVVALLKREVVRTQSASEQRDDRGAEYRAMLIKAMHTCAVKFPEVATSAVPVLMDFLNGDGAMDVIVFVRAVVESYPELREHVVGKLLEYLPDIKSSRVYRVALWIVAEYCESLEKVDAAWEAIAACVGPLPLVMAEEAATEAGAGAAAEPDKVTTRNVVLSDGTYASQVVVTKGAAPAADPAAAAPTLRKLICGGDFFLVSVLGGALVKLFLRSCRLRGAGHDATKAIQVQSTLILCSAVQLAQALRAAGKGQGTTSNAAGGNRSPSSSSSTGGSGAGAGGKTARGRHMESDSRDRIALCLRMLMQPELAARLHGVWLDQCRAAFSSLLVARKAEEAAEVKVEAPRAQADDLLNFRQLRGKPTLGVTDIDIEDGDVSVAVGAAKAGAANDFSSRLNHVHQLTGFADPVYVEAYVTVHGYDILLEILVINRTPATLTNLTVELATMGDLKLVERPQSHTIGPLDQRTINASIKVSSTETGHIFGTVVYDSPGSAEKTVVNLHDIHLDVMDYIQPASCSDAAFRSMWAEFEWENKVAVNTNITDLSAFLAHIVAKTNMRALTPALSSESVFLASNLYARSIFGEDALVNVSIEKQEDGRIAGYIRIRSKTQGVALSLGDRITAVQRISTNSPAAAPVVAAASS